jgi:hypothetical protein
MFSDFSFVEKRVELQFARLEYWLSQIDAKVAIIEIGAGKAVPTIRHISESLKRKLNATLIRINPSEADGADIPIYKGALEALRELKRLIR